jgi:hypothetical protein
MCDWRSKFESEKNLVRTAAIPALLIKVVSFMFYDAIYLCKKESSVDKSKQEKLKRSPSASWAHLLHGAN